jgi:acyl dehydratase
MTAAPTLYWEDFTQGSAAEYGPRLVTRDEIVAFAAEFDPQPFHLDEDAARASMFGDLAASGWHSCSLLMRIIADGFLLNSSSMGSAGVDEVKWLTPVRPGDRLSVRATVLKSRPSRTRPEMGLVHFLFEMSNQAGVAVMMMTATALFARRATGRARVAEAPAAPA